MENLQKRDNTNRKQWQDDRFKHNHIDNDLKFECSISTKITDNWVDIKKKDLILCYLQ